MRDQIMQLNPTDNILLWTDIKKMPLGKLSKSQIAKGFEVIEEIEQAVQAGSNQTRLEELSSRFFTIIPHNFGRCRPPVIRDAEVIEKKKEMLLVRWSSAAFCLPRPPCLVSLFINTH